MLGYELKKVILKPLHIKIIITALIAGIFLSGLAVWSVYYVDQTGTSHRGLTAPGALTKDKSRWNGPLTDSVLFEVVKKQQNIETKNKSNGPNPVYGRIGQSYRDIEEFINQTLCYGTDYNPDAINQVSLETAGRLNELRKENIDSLINEYGTTAAKKEYLKRQFAKVQTPLEYEPSDAFRITGPFAAAYGLLLVLVISFLTVGVFLDEMNSESRFVYYSTKYGPTRGAATKIFAVFIIATMLYWSGMLLMSLISFGGMGTGGAFASIQTESPYSMYGLNFLERYLLILLSGYVACLFSAGMTLLLFVKTKSAISAMSISFLLFAGLPLLAGNDAFESFRMLMPDWLFHVQDNMNIPCVYQFGTIVCSRVTLLIVLYSFLLIPTAVLSYRGFRKGPM